MNLTTSKARPMLDELKKGRYPSEHMRQTNGAETTFAPDLLCSFFYRLPSSTTPSFSSTTLSQTRAISSARCETSSTAQPPFFRAVIVFSIISVEFSSAPTVGSSSRSSFTSPTNAQARFSRRCIPPEYVETGLSALSARFTFSKRYLHRIVRLRP